MALVFAIVMIAEAAFSYLRRFEWPIILQYLFASASLFIYLQYYWIALFCIQRLNDRRRNPWWVLVVFLPFAVLEFARHAYPLGAPLNPYPVWLYWVIALSVLFAFWILIEMAFRKSKQSEKSDDDDKAAEKLGSSPVYIRPTH